MKSNFKIPVTVEVKMSLSLWDAIKLRIAGKETREFMTGIVKKVSEEAKDDNS